MNKFLTILTEKNILCMCTVQLYINCTIYNGLGHNILYLRRLLCDGLVQVTGPGMEELDTIWDGGYPWGRIFISSFSGRGGKIYPSSKGCFLFSARVAAHARCVFVVHSFVSAAVRRVGSSGMGALVLVMAE